MNKLEHLIENGLCLLNGGKSYREWRKIMQEDCNWEGNENITIDNLWEICQYVIFTWGSETTFVRCKDCKYCGKEPNKELFCDILAEEYEPLGSKKVNEDWFCADGERRDDDG